MYKANGWQRGWYTNVFVIVNVYQNKENNIFAMKASQLVEPFSDSASLIYVEIT